MSTETEAPQIEAQQDTDGSGDESLDLDLSFFDAPDDGDGDAVEAKDEVKAEAKPEAAKPEEPKPEDVKQDWATQELDRLTAEARKVREEKAQLEALRKQHEADQQRRADLEQAVRDGDWRKLKSMGFDADRFFASYLDDDSEDDTKAQAKQRQPGVPTEYEKQLAELRAWKEAQEQREQQQMSQRQRAQAIEYLKTNLNDGERWGLIQADGSFEAVLREMETQAEQGIQMPFDKAADIVEKRLEQTVEALARLDNAKLRRLLGLQAAQAQAQKTKAAPLPKGVTNDRAAAGVPHREIDYDEIDRDELIALLAKTENPFAQS